MKSNNIFIAAYLWSRRNTTNAAIACFVCFLIVVGLMATGFYLENHIQNWKWVP